MNKSKFLKKSLAMLLALMLVLAMIPLSASAATTDYIEDLYVNGERAAAVGDDLSVTVKSTTVGISAAALNGATLYYVDAAGNDQPVLASTIDLKQYDAVAENKYELTIKAKAKVDPATDDYEDVAEYQLTITIEEPGEDNDDSSLRGLAKDDPTWDNMTNYVVDTKNEEILVTLKFGYNEPTPLEAADFAATAADEGAKVYVSGKTVTVVSAQGSTSKYEVKFENEPAFESFTIPGQTGETEFEYSGSTSTGNKINISVPYGYDLSKVVPTFELVDGLDYLWVYGNSEHPLISGEREINLGGSYPTGTATLSLFRDDGTEVTIALTISAVPENPEGLLNSLRVYVGDGIGGWTTSNTTDTTTGTTHVEMPNGVVIPNNTFNVELNASAKADIVVIDANKNEHTATADADGKATVNGIYVNEGRSFTVRVTSEDGKSSYDYNIVLNPAPTKSAAELKNIVLKDTSTGDTYEAVWNGKDGTITVPYSWIHSGNTAGVKVYMTASTGASIYVDGSMWSYNGSDFNNLAYVNAWLPDVGTTEKVTYKVFANDGVTSDTYTLKIVTEPAKTERVINDLQFVGVNQEYKINENNTYDTEIGTAKDADGNTVNTIKITVPNSWTNGPAYLYTLDMSEGAQLYQYTGTAWAAQSPVDQGVMTYTPSANNMAAYLDAVENGVLNKNKAVEVRVLSEKNAINNVAGAMADPDEYTPYFIYVVKAPAETGCSIESIESTLDKNVTASLSGNTITINVPASYLAAGGVYSTTKERFSLNIETSKLAEIYADYTADPENYSNRIYSDEGLGKPAIANTSEFAVYSGNKQLYLIGPKGDGSDNIQLTGTPDDKIYVRAEDKKHSQAYTVKLVINKAETGADITALSVNGTAATIAGNKITARLPLGSKLYPVSLDIEASKMAKVEISYDGGKTYSDYDSDDVFDVNKSVTIKVTSEDTKTTKTYTLNAVVSDSFNDVPTSEWYYDEVMTAANAGWINGTKPGYFEPNGTMTRGDFAVIIARILGCDTEATVESKFPDCNETDYFNAAVTFCKLRGIIDGDDKGYFNPYDAITREEMAKILCNALELDELETSANPFDDDAEIAQWAKGYVNAVQAEGIMEGSNGSFNPRDNATRAEGAAVLVRAFA